MPAIIALLLLTIVIGGAAVSRPARPTRALSPDETAHLRDLVTQGQEVQAIREFRQITGASLKDAVQRVRNLR